MKRKLSLVLMVLCQMAGLAMAGTAMAKVDCPLRIGFVRPETGGGASFGHSLEEGLNMGFKEVNAAGGIAGCQVTLVSYDSQSIPSNAAALVRRLIDQDHVPLIIGSSPSPEVAAMMNITENAGVPFYVPSAAASNITTQGFKWVWRQSVIDTSVAKLLIDYIANTLHWKRVGIVYENTNYAKPVVTGVVVPLLTAKGTKVVDTEAYNPGDTDLSGQLLRIRDAGADGLIFWGNQQVGAILTTENYELKVNLPMVANTGVVYPGYLALLSDKVQAATKLIAAIPFVWTSGNPKQLAWVKAFKAIYHVNPDVTSVDGYDAVFFLKKAITAAGSMKPEALSKSFSSTVYDGIGGKISYDKTGQAARALEIVKLTPKSGPGFQVIKTMPAGQY
jgi:branched-chain amino acid transport system substrate-binding protein